MVTNAVINAAANAAASAVINAHAYYANKYLYSTNIYISCSTDKYFIQADSSDRHFSGYKKHPLTA